MRKKLIGIHCSTIMIEELDETRHKKEKFFLSLVQVIKVYIYSCIIYIYIYKGKKIKLKSSFTI